MSFTYYVIKNEDLYGKLKNDGSVIDYVYGPEPSKIWWRNLWTAPYNEWKYEWREYDVSFKFY